MRLMTVHLELLIHQMMVQIMMEMGSQMLVTQMTIMTERMIILIKIHLTRSRVQISIWMGLMTVHMELLIHQMMV